MAWRRKSGVFFASMVWFKFSFFLKFHSAGTYVIQSQHSTYNLQYSRCVWLCRYRVTTFLSPNEQWIIEWSLREKFTLNFNREISYHELTWRPWFVLIHNMETENLPLCYFHVIFCRDREIQFYELSTFEPYCQVTGLETTPLKLDYW